MDSTNYKKLTLSDKKVILGVCGGLAEYLNIPPNLMRFIWIIFGIASLGTAIIVYIVLRFIIPVKKNVERDEII
jgi:phage shock protein C